MYMLSHLHTADQRVEKLADAGPKGLNKYPSPVIYSPPALLVPASAAAQKLPQHLLVILGEAASLGLPRCCC
jgi:hypothetical protein